ncbi:MAG TPA: DUF3014 domain-containing protein [Rhodanobacteraceae bacterium]
MVSYGSSARRHGTPWWAWLAGALAIVGAIGIGVYVAKTGKRATTELPAANPQSSTSPAPAAIQHPIDQALSGTNTDTAPLPALDQSDAAVVDALAGMFGAAGLSELLNPEHVIPRIVATIDSLPRQKLAADALPVHAAQGTFEIRRASGRAEIDARNFARYDAYARVAQAIDAQKLVAWYAHNYPLFQQAYRELGYPDGYFNDRLVFVIDHLLATPDVAEPVALVQPNVTYEYADPTLESRSAGQKLLMRTGPENEATIKAKLREIRSALTGGNLPAG